MGAHVSRTDFEWVHDDEPHASRRKVILKKYPEIRQLMRPDPWFKWQVTAMVFTQFLMFFLLEERLRWPTLPARSLLLRSAFYSTYVPSCWPSTRLAPQPRPFGHGVFPPQPVSSASSPTCLVGLPASIYLPQVPPGAPSVPGRTEQGRGPADGAGGEAVLLHGHQAAVDHPAALLLRLAPGAGLPQASHRPRRWSTSSYQLAFDALVYKFCGGRVLFYMIGGSLMAMGLHPVAGHFVSEHYMFKKGYETYSYYGCLNWVTFNVGYHMEHHDFPGVPGSKLPLVKKIAGEFYDDLPRA
uniref:Putative fatty acid desaturase n=1 Tax=Ixodes ricinus TaxID=34613 RepID=A0A090XDI1_IXORI